MARVCFASQFATTAASDGRRGRTIEAIRAYERRGLTAVVKPDNLRVCRMSTAETAARRAPKTPADAKFESYLADHSADEDYATRGGRLTRLAAAVAVSRT